MKSLLLIGYLCISYISYGHGASLGKVSNVEDSNQDQTDRQGAVEPKQNTENQGSSGLGNPLPFPQSQPFPSQGLQPFNQPYGQPFNYGQPPMSEGQTNQQPGGRFGQPLSSFQQGGFMGGFQQPGGYPFPGNPLMGGGNQGGFPGGFPGGPGGFPQQPGQPDPVTGETDPQGNPGATDQFMPDFTNPPVFSQNGQPFNMNGPPYNMNGFPYNMNASPFSPNPNAYTYGQRNPQSPYGFPSPFSPFTGGFPTNPNTQSATNNPDGSTQQGTNTDANTLTPGTPYGYPQQASPFGQFNPYGQPPQQNLYSQFGMPSAMRNPYGQLGYGQPGGYGFLPRF